MHRRQRGRQRRRGRGIGLGRAQTPPPDQRRITSFFEPAPHQPITPPSQTTSRTAPRLPNQRMITNFFAQAPRQFNRPPQLTTTTRSSLSTLPYLTYDGQQRQNALLSNEGSQSGIILLYAYYSIEKCFNPKNLSKERGPSPVPSEISESGKLY